ncbi:NUDIX domain-containing protein [Candidatus Hepatincolaceae symbiont of Richtersius coronifer]
MNSFFLNQAQYFTSLNPQDFSKVYVKNSLIGYINEQTLQFLLANYAKDFELRTLIVNSSLDSSEDNQKSNQKSEKLDIIPKSPLPAIYLKSTYQTFNDISNFFDNLLDSLQNYITLGILIKKTNEYLLVKGVTTLENLFKIDRGIAALFGVISEGIHINGYIEKDKKIYMWIAKRAAQVVEAHKYDNMVGGAISYGCCPEQTVIKESHEEASIPKHLASSSKQVGKIAYKIYRNNGIRNDVIYMYDLKLPLDYKPTINDQEVEGFYLLDLQEVYHLLINDKFKYNSGLIVSYFLLRNNALNNYESQLLKSLFIKLLI